jgi:hypothetical protein
MSTSKLLAVTTILQGGCAIDAASAGQPVLATAFTVFALGNACFVFHQVANEVRISRKIRAEMAGFTEEGPATPPASKPMLLEAKL